MPRKRTDEIEKDIPGGKLDKPHQRNAANARERSRMRVLSKAFSRLKTTLPWVPPDTKLSKLDTLRLASSYIAHLKQMLDHEEIMQAAGYTHPRNLTWPFTFNGRSFCGSHNKSARANSDRTITSSSSDSSSSNTDIDSPQPGRTLKSSHVVASH